MADKWGRSALGGDKTGQACSCYVRRTLPFPRSTSLQGETMDFVPADLTGTAGISVSGTVREMCCRRAC